MLAVFKGVLLGLTMAILIGPALFSLLQTSLNTGVKSGMYLAFGIILSDIVVVCLAFLGILQLFDTKNNFLIAGVVGGIILIIFGVFTYYKKVHIDSDANRIQTTMSSPITYVGKGFLLNFMNPFVWFFWISAMLSVSGAYPDSKLSVIYFFIGTLSTVFVTDVVKVVIASKIKNKLNTKWMIYINRIAGVILAIFGVVLIAKAIFTL